MDLGLSGKRVLITGGSGGLGAAIARALAAEGARVAINFVGDTAPAERLASELSDIVLLEADISDPAHVARMYALLDETWQGLDILINNAGIDGPRAVSWEADPTAWAHVLDVNLKGAFYCAREALARMVRARCGVILNTTSVHEVIPWTGYGAYAASKAGLAMLAKTMAQEAAPHGVRVLSIAPGAIKTPINSAVWKDVAGLADLRTKIPLGRMGTPEEVARLVTVLVSNVASYVTGTSILIDGGMTDYPAFAHGG